MTPHSQRAHLPPLPEAHGGASPHPSETEAFEPQAEPGFEAVEWSESEPEQRPDAASGRRVLGGALLALALLWTGFTAWSAGRALSGDAMSAPALAQWLAILAAPLGLLGLGWLIFGRTRRREAERFTRSVAAMRSEARSLEALLDVLSQRLADSQSALTGMTEKLMGLADEATGRIAGVARELDTSSERLVRHGEALDRAAESARTDIAVLLDDLPRAEAEARAVSGQLQAIGTDSAARTAELGVQVTALAERTQAADEMVAAAGQRLVTHLTHIESAGAAAAMRVAEAESGFSGALDALLDRTARTLDEIRGGLDVHSQAVTALVQQSSAGIGRAGIDAADALKTSVEAGNSAIDGLSARVAEQERASQRMMAEIDRGLTMIDQRFGELAANGDQRANHFLESLGRARSELDSLAQQATSQDGALGGLAERAESLSAAVARLSTDIREGLAGALGEAEGGAGRVLETAQAARPEIDWVRDAAIEASERIAAANAGIGDQQDRFAALLASVDDGVGHAQSRLAELSGALTEAQGEASRLTAETGPALVAALVQVREAAAHAAERAREAIARVIPDSAGKLSQATRDALEAAIRESIEDRLRGVEQVAARAVEAARTASDRLTQQMITLGQTSAALEAHIEQTQVDSREKDSEAFARRVALLMDSMHSAAIDVGKILSDEIDEKAWTSYLKGNRGVFTRRAVRLMGGGDAKAIRERYEADGEFQLSVNRYVHDFEAMLRRVLAERDGGMMAVTLMSSDMGKLYAALAGAIERRR